MEVEDDEEMINAFFDKEVELLETEAVFRVENDEKSDVNMENVEKEKS